MSYTYTLLPPQRDGDTVADLQPLHHDLVSQGAELLPAQQTLCAWLHALETIK